MMMLNGSILHLSPFYPHLLAFPTYAKKMVNESVIGWPLIPYLLFEHLFVPSSGSQAGLRILCMVGLLDHRRIPLSD